MITRQNASFFRSSGFVPSMDARLIMRMMEKSRKQPDLKSFNGRTYESLMHHSAKRRENDNCMADAVTIYAEIHRFMGQKTPHFETIFLTVSKKVINAFPIHEGSWNYHPRGIGLYLGLSALDHSCRPDAFVVNQGSKMILRTTKEDCVYSDKLTISYFEGLFFLDTDVRRGKLCEKYFFFCECEECKDLESNKKKTAGRPVCCPTSWFSVFDRSCKNCKKEVSSELAYTAEDAMERIRRAVCVYTNNAYEGIALPVLVPTWIKLLDTGKKVLSDENTFLFAIMNMIYVTMLPTDEKISCNFSDLCLLLASFSFNHKNPHCVYSANLFARRQYYVMEKKPLQEMDEALNEAIISAQVVFGPEHDLTKALLEKKILLDIANLNLH